MVRSIFCQKLKKQADALLSPPLPGALGQRIFENISQEAWKNWQAHQTMLINEYRLSMIDPKAKTFLLTEMEKFLFGDGSEKPPGFVGHS
nr:oxidative damage protection protein [Gammaproteobacteria bacterium]